MISGNAGANHVSYLAQLWGWAQTNSGVAVALLVGLLAALATFIVGCLSSFGVLYASRNTAKMQIRARKLEAGEELYQLLLSETEQPDESGGFNRRLAQHAHYADPMATIQQAQRAIAAEREEQLEKSAVAWNRIETLLRLYFPQLITAYLLVARRRSELFFPTAMTPFTKAEAQEAIVDASRSLLRDLEKEVQSL